MTLKASQANKLTDVNKVTSSEFLQIRDVDVSCDGAALDGAVQKVAVVEHGTVGGLLCNQLALHRGDDGLLNPA